MIKSSKLPAKIKDQITYHYSGDKFVKRPKYSNRSCQCWNKKHAPHQSILEADLCNQLNAMQQAGEIKEYRTQHKINMIVNHQSIGNHFVDFLVIYPDNRVEFWEAKGYDQPLWLLKKKIVEAMFGKSIPYVVKYEKPRFFKGAK